MNALSDTEIDILSGDDFTYAALTAMGFSGVISVLSNPAPRLSVDWYDAANQGNVSTLRELRKSLLPLTAELFEDTNPLPCKALMSEMGLLKMKHVFHWLPYLGRDRQIQTHFISQMLLESLCIDT